MTEPGSKEPGFSFGAIKRRGDARRLSPEPFFAVETLVEIGDKFAVAVEHQSRAAFASADQFFARLAPARMRHLGIDVGPEAVLGGLQLLPHALWPLVDEGKLHDRLDRLEAILP